MGTCPPYHTSRPDDKGTYPTRRQPPSGATRRRPTPQCLLQLLPVLLGDITILGPSADGGWLIGWGLDPTVWPLTRGEIRGWIECHLSDRVSDKQVDRFYDYVCGVAARCHAAAQCTAHCEKENALDELTDLIDTQYGVAP
jgi:hypothetical protein